MKSFDARIVIEHTGADESAIPGRMQPEFVAALERGDPRPKELHWSDMRRSNETVIVYQLGAENQFEALAALRRIFETVVEPRLAHFEARLARLEAEESRCRAGDPQSKSS